MPQQEQFMRGREIRNICCIGGGYVGGPSAAVIANKAPHLEVAVVDIDASRIAAWNSDTLPVYEPNLFDLVKPARDGTPTRRPNLRFSTEIEEEVRKADIVFVGVNTPTKKSGLGAGKASDLSWLEAATRRVAGAAERDLIVVEKSTVPCGTAQMMRQILRDNGRPDLQFEVLSNPEFLAEGTAVTNLVNPDRVLIGCLETESGYMAAHSLADVYASWVPREKLITMNLWSSELSKLAANAMLAQRISSINALSSICEAVNANIQDLSFAVGLDRRIGPKMLNASVGFGGSCFKKDVMNLVYISETLGLHEVASYFQAIIEVNEYQMARFVRNIVHAMHSTLSNKKLAIFGFAYKKDTGDTRESPAITVVKQLLAENALVHIYDPQVPRQQIWADLGVGPEDKQVTIHDNPYDACQEAHAVIILTEWDMFCTKSKKAINNTPSSSSQLRAAAAAAAAAETTQFQQQSPPPHPSSDATSSSGSRRSLTASEAGSSSSSEVMDSMTDVTVPTTAPASTSPATVKEATTTTTTTPDSSSKEVVDWQRIVKSMNKPSYLFDGRNTVDISAMQQMGFKVHALGVATTQSSFSSSP